jgi:hypothetical protein
MRLRVVLLGAILAALASSAALADGDPASDILYGRERLPAVPPPSAAATSDLEEQIAAVYARGERIKVAVIAPTGGFGVSLSVPWRVPASLAPGPVRYCVTASDPSGNRGRDCTVVLVSKA